MPLNKWLCHYAVVALSAASASCGSAEAARSDALSAADSLAIRAVRDNYVEAWMADDTARVLALFAPDGMIMPPGSRPRQGHQALRDHWWPLDGSTTKLLRFLWKEDELQGHGPLAIMRGESMVAWEYRKGVSVSRDSSTSVNLTVFSRSGDGAWHIRRQMWGPALR